MSAKKTIRSCSTLPVSWWDLIAKRLIESIRYQVRDLRYFKGVPYKKHDPFWFTKGSGENRKAIYAEDYPTRKANRKAAPKGAGQSSTSTVPDLTLTGKMLDGLEIQGRITEKGFTIGWVGAEAAKVGYNADMGRAITTASEPLIPPVRKEFYDDIDKNFAKRCRQSSSVTNVELKL